MIIPAYYEERVYEDIDIESNAEPKFETVEHHGYIFEFINIPFTYATDKGQSVMYLVRMLIKKDHGWGVETRNEETVIIKDKDANDFIKRAFRGR